MGKKYFSYSDEDVRDVVLELHPRIVSYIKGILGRNLLMQYSPDDIFYDVICTFLDRKVKIEKGKVQAYLFRAVRNKCLNILERRKAENSSLRIDSAPATAWDILASADFGEEMTGTDTDTLPDLHEVIAYSDSLPTRTRNIFYMSRIEGMTHQKIAEELGISTRAVEKHLQNSVKEYREHFGLKDGKTRMS